jgi:hypothetical protein
MKYRIIIIWYYIEVGWSKFTSWLGFKKDTFVIPRGFYCYVFDNEKNIKEPHKNGGYWIKSCPYYRSMKGQCNAGCTYIGFIGFDPCLGDQCKICGINEEDEIELRKQKIQKISKRLKSIK